MSEAAKTVADLTSDEFVVNTEPELDRKWREFFDDLSETEQSLVGKALQSVRRQTIEECNAAAIRSLHNEETKV